MNFAYRCRREIHLGERFRGGGSFALSVNGEKRSPRIIRGERLIVDVSLVCPDWSAREPVVVRAVCGELRFLF